MNICVIGAGASGLTAAITAAKAGANVQLLEQQKKAGRKLCATGNGKCNLLNKRQDISCFHSHTPWLLLPIIEQISPQDIIGFFEDLGISVENRQGYLYPSSFQAASVTEALLYEAKQVGVTCHLSNGCTGLEKKGTGFLLHTQDGKSSFADRVILATGSPAGGMGQDDAGFRFLQSFSLKMYPFLPALVQIRLKESLCRQWAGVRIAGEVAVLEDGACLARDKGELQLTEYGISGIPVFQVSGTAADRLFVKPGASLQLQIDFLPEWSEPDLLAHLEMQGNRHPKKDLVLLLWGILPDRLANAIVKHVQGISGLKMNWGELNVSRKKALIRQIKNGLYSIQNVNPVEKAQVCQGGLSLKEIYPDTMEIRKCPGLFAAGELLDVYGDCGGYNLQWAWTTGILAGRGAALSPLKK